MSLKRITFGELVELCLHTPGFFGHLQKDPAKALESAGYEPTPIVIEALKKIDYTAIRNLWRACDPTVAPMC